MLVVMRADGDDELIDEMASPTHDVDMAIGDRIEAAGIEAHAHARTPGARAASSRRYPRRVPPLLAAQLEDRQGAYSGGRSLPFSTMPSSPFPPFSSGMCSTETARSPSPVENTITP